MCWHLDLMDTDLGMRHGTWKIGCGGRGSRRTTFIQGLDDLLLEPSTSRIDLHLRISCFRLYESRFDGCAVRSSATIKSLITRLK